MKRLVLHDGVGILGLFCPEQGHGFNPPAVPLYPYTQTWIKCSPPRATNLRHCWHPCLRQNQLRIFHQKLPSDLFLHVNLHPLALLVKVSLHNNCKQIQKVPWILTWTSPCPCAELRFFSVSILWKTELCFNLSVLYTLFMRHVSAKERKLLSHLTLGLLHVYIGVVTRTTSSGGGGGGGTSHY